MEGFCTNCGQRKTMNKEKSKRLPNTFHVIAGTCKDCGAPMLKQDKEKNQKYKNKKKG